jgi:DnaA family protein
LSQLALPLKLQDHAVFESFLPAGNETLVGSLEALVEQGKGPGAWIWGAASTGKTHLLQAVCERAGDRTQFVPLLDLKGAGPDILSGLETRQIVCVDDIDSVAGDHDWELALFSLANQLADVDGVLVCAAKSSPRESGIRLADLASRLARLTTFHLRELDQDARIDALTLRARHRGLELPEETASYLLNRSRRDMTSLYSLLDRLDNEALKAQRRLTIPFVREVIGGGATD